MSEHAQFPPTPAWTEHERMLVVYRIAGLMQRRAQRALVPWNLGPTPITPEDIFAWGERIKMVVSMDRDWLELHRHELLRDLTPPDGAQQKG